MRNTNTNGFTLIELMVSVGLFAVVMTLATGAYLEMLALNRQAQGVATGTNDLSFALETMTRSIRTGSSYSCGSALNGGDCATTGQSSFTFVDTGGDTITYSRQTSGSTGYIQKTVIQSASHGGATLAPVLVTDPAAENITGLTFTVSGTQVGDGVQAHVTMIVSGSIPNGPNKPAQTFTIETGATMRGLDI